MKNSIDKLVLGTVQFGLNYGISNISGKPSKEESLEMLKFSYEKGIKIFDTAYAYGCAEEILGEFIKDFNLIDKIRIVTKLQPNIIDEYKEDFYDVILENLCASLKRLNMEYVDGYLLHTPSYIRNEKLVDSLVKLKKVGLVKNIGVSIYEESDAIYAAKLDMIDYIQIPYSIFDQRLNKTDFFEIAKNNNKTIFARSAFLQGLIFMSDDKIPSYLENVKKYLKEFDIIIKNYNLSRQQAALLFSYKDERIDYVVFGVDKINQLQEDINIIENNIECKQCINDLKNRFIDIEKSIIFPSLWKNN